MRSENESPSNTKDNEHHTGGMDRRQGKGAGWRSGNGGGGGGGVGGQMGVYGLDDFFGGQAG